MYAESRIARKDYLWIACSRIALENKEFQAKIKSASGQC